MNCVFETAVSLGSIVGVEDSFDVPGDVDPHRDLRDVGHGVLDRVQLATLPRHAGHDGLSGRLETGMIVTDNELHPVHAAVQKALEELPPVVFGFAEFNAAAEDGPLAVRGDADGRKDRTGDNGTAVADLFVQCIQDKVGDLTDGPAPPTRPRNTKRASSGRCGRELAYRFHAVIAKIGPMGAGAGVHDGFARASYHSREGR